MHYFRYTLILLILSLLPLKADYIKNAVIVCPNLKDIKTIEPHINKDTNKYFLPKGCLILTSNAKVSVTKIIDDNYLLLFIHDLNSSMYSLNQGVVLEKSTSQI